MNTIIWLLLRVCTALSIALMVFFCLHLFLQIYFLLYRLWQRRKRTEEVPAQIILEEPFVLPEGNFEPAKTNSEGVLLEEWIWDQDPA